MLGSQLKFPLLENLSLLEFAMHTLGELLA
jgi:hypothetical protein